MKNEKLYFMGVGKTSLIYYIKTMFSYSFSKVNHNIKSKCNNLLSWKMTLLCIGFILLLFFSLILFVSIIKEPTIEISPIHDESNQHKINILSNIIVSGCLNEKNSEKELTNQQNLSNSSIDYIDCNQTLSKDKCWCSELDEKIAQSFKPRVNKLTRMKLYGIKKGDPVGPLHISIKKTINGPDIVSTTIYPKDFESNQSKWFEVDFDDISVKPGDTYFIVWSVDFCSYENYYWIDYYRHPNHPEKDAYENGDEYRNGVKYSLNDFCFEIYGYSIPVVNIIKPKEKEIVCGKYTINGTAHDKEGELQKVEIKFNDDKWQLLEGIHQWQYSIDSYDLENGIHYVNVRSYDGFSYSEIENRSFVVENAQLTIKWIKNDKGCVNAKIENRANVNATNIMWNITINGGLLKRINDTSNGFLSNMNSGEEVEISSEQVSYGFGFLRISVRSCAHNAGNVEWKTFGFKLGNFLLVF